MKKTFLLLVLTCLLLVGCSSENESPGTNNSVPDVQLNSISDITSTSATVNGDVISSGGSNITSRGFVWGTSSNPDQGDNSVTIGNGTGSFTGNLLNLQSGTTYFIRAFATNSNGTSYSGEQSFNTLNQNCENVANGNVFLRNQQEVNQFGEMGYCEITGWLDISDVFGEPIVDLSPLSSVEKVGLLRIIGTEQLETLDGLNINTIEKDLEIAANEGLININALSAITSSINTVRIVNNNQLINIQGLSGLTNFVMVENESPLLHVAGNILMEDINGLQNVQIFENGQIEIRNNFQLSNIDGLSSFPNTINSLTLYSNDNLSDLGGISHFTSLPGDLNLEYNNNSNLDDLSSLTSVGGNLRILFDGSDPVSISGINNLSEVGGELEILSHPPLANIDALESLVSVGSLTLYNINTLTNLNGLSNLVSIINDLYISDNDELTNLCGLTTLITNNGLGGTYYVQNNGYDPTEQDIIDGNCSI
ncbi:MAG: hypothetical protein DWP94_02060 [Flavobacterium sp.]|nr:MAG: hypothetical protein DWP94_02060 [Flavobacterium sp.]